MGFENGFHGNSIHTLSASDRAANIQNIPTLDWPIAQFPKLKYPLAQYEHENRQEEDRCLENVNWIISDRKN